MLSRNVRWSKQIKMLIGIFVIFVLSLADESLSSALSGNNFSSILSECSTNQKVQANMVPKAGTADIEANITATFYVGLADDSSITGSAVTGSIEWIFNDDTDTTTLIVKVLPLVDGQVQSIDYYLLYVDDVTNEYTDGKHAVLNCINTPTSVNTTIKAEVYRTNTTSCDCDVIKMAVKNCLPQCQMNLISSRKFHVSKDACFLYRENDQDDLLMNLRGEMVAKEITTFHGYFSNVNPFSSARVSIFPDDDLHFPHVPILSFPVQIETNGEIYFSVETANMGYFDFYAKLQVTCPDDFFSDDYISESIKVKPYEVPDSRDRNDDTIFDVTDAAKSEQSSKESNTEIFYGVMIALLVVACIITVIVWVTIMRRNQRRSGSPSRQGVDKELQTKLCSAPSVLIGKTSEMNNCSNMTTKTKNVMMLTHPDTVKHEEDVEDLVTCLQMHDVQVHNRPEVHFQNWRDFAEKAGEEYKDIVIVMSRGLIDLCEIYKSKGRTTCVNIENVTETNLHCTKQLENKQTSDKRWFELLEQRNGEYIPCVALDKIRIVLQDGQSDVGIHFVTFCDKVDNCTSGDCNENKLKVSDVMNCKLSESPSFKQNQTYHHHQQQQHHEQQHFYQQQHFKHHGDDNSSNSLNSEHDKNQMKDELEYFLKSSYDHIAVCDFIRHNTFLQTRNTYFHTISRNVLKYLLLSGKDNGVGTNSLSLIYVLRNIR